MDLSTSGDFRSLREQLMAPTYKYRAHRNSLRTIATARGGTQL